MNLKMQRSTFLYKIVNPERYGFITHIGILFVSIYLLSQSLATFEPSYKTIFLIIGCSVIFLLIASYSLKWDTFFGKMKTVSIVYSLLMTAVFLTYGLSSLIVTLDNKGLETILNENMELAKLIYFSVCYAQPIILPVPEIVTVVAGSAALGPFTAFILGFIGAVLGILTMFYLSRTFGMKMVQRLVNEKQLDQYHRFVKKNERWILILLFIVPVLPDEIICVGAGVSGVKTRRFIMIAILAKVVTTFSLAYSLGLTELV
ncbi:TVP38/TMEM64 family protein [Fictibacillus phosphorivorans]|uniref:TVP38/TMEM64 family protein n=1 Tax=Fictibacillus phosphorivorans TaxID=1221500 RepID=UPI0012935C3F|nr:VTT domain-containing protein [Fictibacillus phosphorivorans]MQR94310.1 DedA family protein [Fictibacillus phosphorivorans]